MKISIVIPCYNSAKTIEEVISRIIKVFNENNSTNASYEIITVNDCSPDNVWEVLKENTNRNKNIKAINLLANTNKNGAVMAGLANATGDYIVVCDDDGQSPIEKLWDLIEPLKESNVDVSIAKYSKYKQSFFKEIVTYINNKTLEIFAGVPSKIRFTNFIAIKKTVVETMMKTKNANTYIEGLIFKITKNIVNVELEEEERIVGKSNFTLKKLINMWLDEITEFSIRPLRIASVIGTITAFLGFVYGIVIIFEKIFNVVTVDGYSSIMSAILFIGGMIMMILGIIGEYIGRIYININNIPQYVIKESINLDDKKEI